MKTFTARDLNEKRQEIKDALLEDGTCIIEFKRLDRSVEVRAVMNAIDVERYQKESN